MPKWETALGTVQSIVTRLSRVFDRFFEKVDGHLSLENTVQLLADLMGT